MHARPSEAGREYDRLRECDVRRWCWTPGWWFIRQDEDLFMEGKDVIPLLEEAREGCRKPDHAISIVNHHFRDSVHHALWDGAKNLGDSLARVPQWIEPSRAAQAEALVEYLRRLASYAVPRSVEPAEVAQRVLDLRRCDPNPSDVPQVRLSGAHWVARLDRANVTRGALFVDVESGRMWAQVE